MMTAELLPCPNPWCHPSDTLFPVLRWDGMNAALVECNSCGMQGPSSSPVEFNDDGEEVGTKDAEAEAIAAWNQRASLVAKDAEIAGLRHEAQFLCDRLDSLEWSDGLSGYEQVLREYFGHVEPSHARLKALLHQNPESKA